MLVSSSIIEEIYRNTGEEEIERANKLIQNDMVKITKATYDDENNFELQAKVRDQSDTHDVYIRIQKNKIAKISCTCGRCTKSNSMDYHIIATIYKFDNSKEYANAFGIEKAYDNRLYNKANQYKTFNQIINTFYSELEKKDEITKITNKKLSTDLINLRVGLVYNSNDNEMKVELKLVSGKNSYIVKNLVEFYDNFMDGGVYKYGNNVEFKHSREMIREKDYPILDFFLKYAEIMKYTNKIINQQHYGKIMNEGRVVISNTGLDDLFDVLDGEYVGSKIDLKRRKSIVIE